MVKRNRSGLFGSGHRKEDGAPSSSSSSSSAPKTSTSRNDVESATPPSRKRSKHTSNSAKSMERESRQTERETAGEWQVRGGEARNGDAGVDVAVTDGRRGPRNVASDEEDSEEEGSIGGGLEGVETETVDVGRDSALSRDSPGSGSDSDEEMDGGSSQIQQRRAQKGQKAAQRITGVEGEEDAGQDKFNEAGDEITPFNLKAENEEGYYDRAGNFVWKKEEEKVQEDAWLDEANEEEIEKTAMAAEQKRRVEAEREQREEGEGLTASQCRRRLLRLLQRGEAVLQALRRLGGNKKSHQMRKAKREKDTANQAQMKPAGEDAGTAETEEQKQTQKRDFESLTEAADALMGQGLVNIYQETYESILAAEAAAVEQEQRKVPAMWLYKGEDENIHGPFSTAAICQWRAQGYFTGASAVFMKESPRSTEQYLGPGGKTSEAEAVDTKTELMADLDDDDDEPDGDGDTHNGLQANGGSTDQSAENASGSASAVTLVQDWTNSDAIDFAAYL